MVEGVSSRSKLFGIKIKRMKERTLAILSMVFLSLVAWIQFRPQPPLFQSISVNPSGEGAEREPNPGQAHPVSATPHRIPGSRAGAERPQPQPRLDPATNRFAVTSTGARFTLEIAGTAPIDTNRLAEAFQLNLESEESEAAAKVLFASIKAASGKLKKGAPRVELIELLGAPVYSGTNSLGQELCIFSAYAGRRESLIGDEFPMLKVRCSTNGSVYDWRFERKPLYMRTSSGLRVIAQ